jgi:hypothetical protein
MHRACSRANISVIGVLSDVKEGRVMKDLSSRTAQEVLDDHLTLAENWGARGASSVASRKISATTTQRT